MNHTPSMATQKYTKGGQWASGLCNSCQHSDVCCCSCVAPFVYLEKNTEKVVGAKPMYECCGACSTPGKRVAVPYGITFYAQLCTYGIGINSNLVALLGAFHCLLVCLHGNVRTEIRKKYNIPRACFSSSDLWDDCCTVAWCYACAITQEYDMLEYEMLPDGTPSAPPAPANFMKLPAEFKGV